MDRFYRIKTPDGAEQLVLELAGHEDAEVLEEGVVAPRVPHTNRINGRWKIDKDKARKEIRQQKFAAMTRSELVDFIEAMIDEKLAKLAESKE